MKKSDHVLIAIKAGISAVPIVGGSIASLIGDYVPLSTQRSVEKTMNLLKDKLIALEGRIDTEAVNKDEFSDLFKSCYLIAMRTSQEEKLRAVSGLIANLLLKPGDPEKISYTELDHFVRCLDGLSVGAIVTLGAVNILVEKSGVSPNNEGYYTVSFERLDEQLDEIQPDLLMGLVGELNAYNLVHIHGRPTIPTGQYGNYPISLTEIGKRFCEWFLEIKP